MRESRTTYDLEVSHEDRRPGYHLEEVTVIETAEFTDREIVLKLHEDFSPDGELPDLPGITFSMTEKRLRMLVAALDKIDRVPR